MAAKLPQLREYRTMARVDIRGLVERWRQVYGLVSGPLSEKSIEDIEEARDCFPQLSSETADKLTKIFEQDSMQPSFKLSLSLLYRSESVPS